MKKSEIKEMANAFVNRYNDDEFTGFEKSALFEGYVSGAMEVLQKLGIEVTADTEG